MGSNDNVIVANSTPFSIRNYVLEFRHKDICRNWPFQEEHLQFCMKLGISRVLPPFESRDSVRNQSNGNDVGSNHAKDEKIIFSSIDKPNVGLDREEEPMKVGNGLLIDKVVPEVPKCIDLLSLSTSTRLDHREKSVMNSNIVLLSMNPKVHLSTTDKTFNNMDQFVATVPTTETLRRKRKKRKGKPKKRSMVDICAEARPCTLEDLDRTDRSNWVDSRSLGPYANNQAAVEDENVTNEVNESMLTVDYNKICMAAEKFWKTKHPRDEIGNDKNLLDKKRCLVKIKLNGSKPKPSKSQKRRGTSLRKNKFKIHELSSATCKSNPGETTKELNPTFQVLGSQNSKKVGIHKQNIESRCWRNVYI